MWKSCYGWFCKYIVLNFFNLILGVLGAISFAFAIYCTYFMSRLFPLYTSYTRLTYGSFLFLATKLICVFLFGSWGLTSKQKWFEQFYRCTMCTLLIMGVVLFFFIGYRIKLQVLKSEVETKMMEQFKLSTHNNPQAKEVFNNLQQTYKCCGVYSLDDYRNQSQALPASCCKIQTQTCSITNPSLYTKPCFKIFYENLDLQHDIMAALIFFVVIFLLIGSLVLCCLPKLQKNEAKKEELTVIMEPKKSYN